MMSGKVKLSPQGRNYLSSPKCSTIVRSILHSIDNYSAEILVIDESIVRVKLLEEGLPEEFRSFNNFAIHKEHLIIS